MNKRLPFARERRASCECRSYGECEGAPPGGFAPVPAAVGAGLPPTFDVDEPGFTPPLPPCVGEDIMPGDDIIPGDDIMPGDIMGLGDIIALGDFIATGFFMCLTILWGFMDFMGEGIGIGDAANAACDIAKTKPAIDKRRFIASATP